MATSFATSLDSPWDVMNFVVWQGPRPQQLRSAVEVVRRPGVGGSGAVVLPEQADPFRVQAIQIYSTQAAAEAAVVGWLDLIGTKVNITWETIAMHTDYSVQYLIVGLETDGWTEIHSFQDYGGTYVSPAFEIDWNITLQPLAIPA